MKTVFRVARRHRAIAVALLHAAVGLAALTTAVLLRFDFELPTATMAALVATAPVFVVMRLITSNVAGMLRASWRHVSFVDAVRLLQGTVIGTLCVLCLLMATGMWRQLPRSVYFLEALLFFLFTFGLRAIARFEHGRRRAAIAGKARRRVLLVGASALVDQFVWQVQSDPGTDIQIVGLVDEDASRARVTVRGVPVLGTIDDLPAITKTHAPDLIVIALATDAADQMRHVVQLCEASRIAFRKLPSMADMLDGRVRAHDLREVQLDDLLGRRPVETEMAAVRRELAGATVLVTGGAGSIGSELARQVARCAPRRLVLLDQAESPLYFAHLEMAGVFPEIEVIPVIACVSDRDRMLAVMNEFKPGVVFHAAAYKHVPMMEAHPIEALRANVFGTLNVAEAAVASGARKFVLISTDKAVNPSSVMGATKRMAELIVLGHPWLQAQGTDFRAVRFGNVLGSAGSVIPLFSKQLASGGPLTVTHPDVRRYFMSIPEASQLVLQAATLISASGRVAMLEMGAPVRIVDLAEQLIRLSGLVPHVDVEIVFTGLRPGEKLDEDLMSTGEEGSPTTIDAVRVLRTAGLSGARLVSALEVLLSAVEAQDAAGIRHALQCAIPEYVPRLNDGAKCVEVRESGDMTSLVSGASANGKRDEWSGSPASRASLSA